MRIVIGGCGRVGAQLADMLSSEHHEVRVIDTEERAFQRLSKVFRGEVVQGDAFDGETLEKAGISEADVFAAVTNYDNTNLMAAEVAEHIYHVPRTVARLYNPDKEGTYQALGMDYICGTREVAGAIMERMLKPGVRLRGKCANNTRMVAEFDLPAEWVRKPLLRLAAELGLEVAWVTRKGEAVFPEEGFRGERGDTVTVLAGEEGLRRLERKLRKARP